LVLSTINHDLQCFIAALPYIVSFCYNISRGNIPTISLKPISLAVFCEIIGIAKVPSLVYRRSIKISVILANNNPLLKKSHAISAGTSRRSVRCYVTGVNFKNFIWPLPILEFLLRLLQLRIVIFNFV